MLAKLSLLRVPFSAQSHCTKENLDEFLNLFEGFYLYGHQEKLFVIFPFVSTELGPFTASNMHAKNCTKYYRALSAGSTFFLKQAEAMKLPFIDDYFKNPGYIFPLLLLTVSPDTGTTTTYRAYIYFVDLTR